MRLFGEVFDEFFPDLVYRRGGLVINRLDDTWTRLSWSGMIRGALFKRVTLPDRYLTPFSLYYYGWGKFLTLVVWNLPEWRIWTANLRISSLEEIFWFSWSETLKDMNLLSQNIFTMVEENLWFSLSWMLQNEEFGLHISEYLHQSSRKLWILMTKSAPELRIWIADARISSP